MKFLNKDMVKKIQFVYLFFLTINMVTAQNLVPNPGFEFYHNLPTRVGEWCAATAWYNLDGDCEYDPNGPNSGSPDYLHEFGDFPVNLPVSTFSTVNPYEGHGIMGLVLWLGENDTISYREYISTKLTGSLEEGVAYTISFYTSNGAEDIRYGGYGSNNLGVYFSVNSPTQINGTALLIDPQFELNEILYNNDWEQISFTFTADDAYEYITIGNFKDNSNSEVQQFESFSVKGSAFYYIDEICVVKAGEDCSILTSINTLKPVVSQLKVFPNPVVNDVLSISFNDIDLNGNAVFIYNVYGDLVHSSSLSCLSEACEISLGDIPRGLYFLTLTFESKQLTQKFIRL